MLTRLLILTLTSVLVTGCATNSTQDVGQLKPGTEWVANSPGWEKEARETFSAATEFIVEASKKRDKNSWAVILDLDETVLNNVEYQVDLDLAGLEYTEPSWFEWTQKEAATLVPGAKDFIDTVNRSGGRVAFVTNRFETEQLATENNLNALGIQRFHDFQVLLTRSPAASSSKDRRFELVGQILSVQGFGDVEVVAYVGDGKGDKPTEAGASQFFCVDQGAMYGDPCAKVPGPGT